MTLTETAESTAQKKKETSDAREQESAGGATDK
jgi:hypothetical protein